MLERLRLKARGQHGAARPLTLAIAVAVILTVASTALAGSRSSASTWTSGDASAQNLATAAANTAVSLAKANGTYLGTGRLPLHKHAALPIAPSRSSAWVSVASGGRNSFSVTATAEPSGDTYTLGVSSTGKVLRSCTATSPAAGAGGCQTASGSANGTW